MKCQIASIAMLAVVLGTGIASAQNSSSSAPPAQNSSSSQSLADLARQIRAERAKSQEKSKVITNDDLAALAPSPAQPSTTAKETKPGEKPSKETSGKETEKKLAEATPPTSGKQAQGEKYYRDQMSKLEGRLETDQRELSVLEQNLGQNQMMYYPDPNKGLLQESGPTAMSDVQNLQDQIAKKKAEIAADEDGIEDLREQLRREGGDPGWLRNVPAGQPNEGPSEQPTGKPGSKDYWESRFKLAHARLDNAQELQELAENELNLLQIQEVRELDPNVKAELAEKVKAKVDEVSQRRAATKEAQKALDDLQREFDPGGGGSP